MAQTASAEEMKPTSTKPNLDPGIYSLAETGMWIVAIIIVACLLRRQLRDLLTTLLARLRAGATFEVAAFKLGALPYVPVGATDAKVARGIIEIRDDDGTFDASRVQFKNEFRNLFLVHRIAPASDPEQLIDIVIYLVPSLKYGSLSGVTAVDYYFGKYWGRKVFRSVDRASGFMIATSAYAPFTCTARICLSDGTHVFLHRYVDFEMGQLPPGTFRRPEV